ncbi:MAG: polysaccharide export protein Wza [Planctomycetota bacterium]|nr:MAG: polysaccharide export protein Wza [Planctomycetota bacterium]
MRLPLVIATLLVAFSATACFSSGKDREPVKFHDVSTSEWYVDEELLDVEPPSSALLEEDDERYVYKLGPGDVLDLVIWGDDAISGNYRIGPDGDITVPLFGSLSLAGKTRDEAGRYVEEVLGESYLDPHATIVVKEFNNNNVFLLGAFQWPGEYKLENQATLLQALSLAKGFLKEADRSALTITRGEDTAMRINLDDLLLRGNRSLNVKLKPGDVIFLPENTTRLVYVMGEVKNPGVVPVGDGLDLLEALAMSGSLTEDSVASEVRIIRPLPGGKQVRVITVDVESIYREGAYVANIPLSADDVIYVPTKGIAQLNYVLRQFTPSLSTIFIVDELQDVNDD